MAEATSDPDSPPHGGAWNGTALAAGAGVLAGLLLGHKGAASLAAGVAAAASVKLLSGPTRSEEPSPDASLLQSMAAVAHTSTAVPVKEPGDWVDNDAVVFGHVIPDPVMAVQMLKEKALPLLDDDGLPVDQITVRPQYPEDLKDDFPTGPIIWEPGRFVQSRSDGAGETVWFSLQDMIREATKLAESPAIQPETIAPALLGAPAEPAFSAPLVELPQEYPVPFSAPAPLLHNPWASPSTPAPAEPALEACADATWQPPQAAPIWEAPSYPFFATTAESAVHPAPSPSPFEPAPEMSPFTPLLPSEPEHHDEGPLTFITPKPYQGVAVLQPRHTDEPLSPFHLTRSEAAMRPGLLTGGPIALSSELAPAHGTSRVGVHTRAMRQLEPVAPVISERRGTSWILVLMSCVMVIVGLFIAADWLSDGELRRRFQDVSWMKSLDQPAGAPDQPAQAPAPAHLLPTGHIPVLSPGALSKPK